MTLPKSWRSRGTLVGWTAFVFLSLPNLFFAIRLGVSEGFNVGKVTLAMLGEAVIGAVSWALGHAVSRSSVILLIACSLLLVAMLIAYGAAISLLIGGLRIKVF